MTSHRNSENEFNLIANVNRRSQQRETESSNSLEDVPSLPETGSNDSTVEIDKLIKESKSLKVQDKDSESIKDKKESKREKLQDLASKFLFYLNFY